MGLAGYYRRYIKDFASIANPLNSLLRTDVSFQLQIINGVLVRNYKIEQFSETRTVLIYPDTMKISVLSQVHDEAGHQGIEKTLSRLKLVAGDPVWLSIPNGGVSRKLNSKWEGGWYIAEIKSPVNMMIKNKEGNIRVVHINRLQSRILREDN